MKQHKFNWVDGLVILVILALVAGTCVKFFLLKPAEIQEATVKIQYTVRVATVRQYSVDALQVGDAIYDEEGKGNVGAITDIRVEPAEMFVTYPDGTTELAPVENRYDVFLTVQANAIEDGGLYKVGTYSIRANQSSSYFTKYLTFGGRVMDVEEAAA